MEQIIDIQSELTKNMKSFMDNGELIPNYLLEEFLKTKLNELENQDILLIGFPRNINHYSILENVLEELNLKIQIIWYIKQKNPTFFLSEYFKDKNQKILLEKYGDEVTEKWNNEFQRQQRNVISLHSVTKNLNWKVIEMEYQAELSEDFIIKRINDCA